jgi:membrane-associated protease RseP (regulator of RpoE activity)
MSYYQRLRPKWRHIRYALRAGISVLSISAIFAVIIALWSLVGMIDIKYAIGCIGLGIIVYVIVFVETLFRVTK